jgi:hypothetical protein
MYIVEMYSFRESRGNKFSVLYFFSCQLQRCLNGFKLGLWVNMMRFKLIFCYVFIMMMC